MTSGVLDGLQRTYADDVPELNEAWQPESVTEPALLAFNDDLAATLGLDAEALRRDALDVFAGNAVPADSFPAAQAYSGHQFGGFSPRLGDGRALMLGELVAPDGDRFDLQLKGSGRTPFARGGDGRAAVGPMLREFVFGEAMHALGVPTTRMLAVVGTGETVRREQELPGAVLVRVAASHLRVGTFQYAAASGDVDVLRRLLDHAVRRHHADALDRADDDGGVALGFFESVVDAQVHTVSRWMALGFVHGVMNTDNVTISGETIDYGPCAFMDTYEPATVFSSIDHGGRYAYGNQPSITAWNLARLAETLLPLIDGDQDRAIGLATTVLETLGDRFADAWRDEVAAKLGVESSELRATGTEPGLADRLLALFREHRVDWTSGWRSLSSVMRGDPCSPIDGDPRFESWAADWLAAVDRSGRSRRDVAAELDRTNPLYVARNHLVEEALTAASDDGELALFERLVDVVRDPFAEQPGAERYAEPAPPGSPRHVTFCGT
ncbi:MAG: YdiU family protein [Actinomycetota bacterium]